MVGVVGLCGMGLAGDAFCPTVPWYWCRQGLYVGNDFSLPSATTQSAATVSGFTLPAFRNHQSEIAVKRSISARATATTACLSTNGGIPVTGNQRWSLVPTANGDHFKIISWVSGKAASITDNSSSDGAQLNLGSTRTIPATQLTE